MNAIGLKMHIYTVTGVPNHSRARRRDGWRDRGLDREKGEATGDTGIGVERGAGV